MLKKIMLPLDGSELAEKALIYARTLSEQFNAELILARVVHPLPVISDYGTAAYEAVIALEQEQAKTYMRGVKERLAGLGTPIRTIIIDAPPVAESLIKLACEEAADLIVMSTHGRSGFSRWIHGSVATKVLQHAPCPVFLVSANIPDPCLEEAASQSPT